MSVSLLATPSVCSLLTPSALRLCHRSRSFSCSSARRSLWHDNAAAPFLHSNLLHTACRSCRCTLRLGFLWASPSDPLLRFPPCFRRSRLRPAHCVCPYFAIGCSHRLRCLQSGRCGDCPARSDRTKRQQLPNPTAHTPDTTLVRCPFWINRHRHRGARSGVRHTKSSSSNQHTQDLLPRLNPIAPEGAFEPRPPATRRATRLFCSSDHELTLSNVGRERRETGEGQMMIRIRSAACLVHPTRETSRKAFREKNCCCCCELGCFAP